MPGNFYEKNKKALINLISAFIAVKIFALPTTIRAIND